MPDDPENLSPEAWGPPPEALAPQPQPPAPPLEPREIWNGRDLLWFLLFVPLALLVSAFSVTVGYIVVRPIAGWRIQAEAVQSNVVFLLIQQGFFYIIVLSFLLLLARVQHHQPLWKSLGWKKPTARQVLAYLAGGGGLALLVSLVLSMRPDTQSFPLEKLFDSRTASYAIGTFAILVAPLVEELVFRGLLFAIFERTVGWRFAVVTTAALFAGLHIPEYWHAWNHLVMILVVGVVFSLARGVTGSLTPSILLHVGYNFLIMTALFFSTQHFHLIGELRWP
jgi:membrane protease YdiL (CAAX protease family)